MEPLERLFRAVIDARNRIRNHRDQKGDNRCWLDDLLVWTLLPDSPPDLAAPPPDAMDRCRAFYAHRRSDTADPFPTGVPIDPANEGFDDGLDVMDGAGLEAELARLLEAVRVHRDVTGRECTLDDDRELYAALPEKVPADFRLPPKDAFLGEACAPHAGCPAFWRSHANCPAASHNLHQWGRCKL